MAKLLKEPLFHFLLLGGLLFAVNEWRERGASANFMPRTVRITENDVLWLKETWARQWQREPNETELRGLVVDYLKESLLAREAEEMGLLENDTLIRRRLAQKVEFLVQDTARLGTPGDEQLREFFAPRQKEFEAPARVSFTQLFFRSEAAARDALQQVPTRPTEEWGERSLLARECVRDDEAAVTSQFGREFATAVFALSPGSWHGPVASAYGFHLVRVSEQQAAQPRSLAEVRDQVLEAWHREEQTRAKEQFFAMLLKKYDVAVDEAVKPMLAALDATIKGNK